MIAFTPGWKESLVALRDLALRAGGRATNARLYAIDLRGRILGNDR
ncbi:MAG: hypothetical protein SGI72_11630 [Planctomycetota bacterium]|nr:hypothetical protein [Planctomycetota bacterium]